MEPHVLVAGATGLVGRAAMEHFARKGVKTTAVSRRRPWDAYGADWLSADLADTASATAVLGGLTDVTQVVFAALHEEPELVSGWLEERHVRRNGEMLKNLVDGQSIAPHRRSATSSSCRGPRPMACMSVGCGPARGKTVMSATRFPTSTGRRKTT